MSDAVEPWWSRGGGVPARILQGGGALRTYAQRLQEAGDVRRGGGSRKGFCRVGGPSEPMPRSSRRLGMSGVVGGVPARIF